MKVTLEKQTSRENSLQTRDIYNDQDIENSEKFHDQLFITGATLQN